MDSDYMQQALTLASKGYGTTSPNPMVGTIIVKNNKIIGKGYHKRAGEPHAEISALDNCTESPKGSVMYVTLEPCAHYGLTPPCVDAIIKAGINHVVIAVRDPNPKVNGKTIKKLKEKGIKVTEGVLEEPARELNKFFFKHIQSGQPYVILKAALTLDGKIATQNLDSKWISCEQSRKLVHKLRSHVDAVLVGKNTVLQDNPRLNSRLHEERHPLRIIAGTQENIPETFHILKGPAKTVFLGKQVNLQEKLTQLGQQGITSILIEGGSNIFTQFIEQELVDEFYFFITPKLLGNSALPLLQSQNISSIKDALQLTFTKVKKVGTDILVIGKYAK
jgi:diaminohydroxyphosphoribosylaminopyrimidine deaminase / 5-amino-6-(5-phosphoribosylamino)uracil reductase